MLPTFQIIGGQKCGTSSLLTWLSAHPGVSAPFVKEVHYFDIHPEKSVNWYRSYFRVYREGIVTGEASPYYLYHPLTPQRMHALIPDAKLIVLLRNPADRAFSHYQHSRRYGFESLSFRDAIDQESSRLKGEEEKIRSSANYISHAHRQLSYLSKGIYADQLARWFEHFPRESFLILNSEEMFANPRGSYRQTTDFIGLPPFELQDVAARNQHGYASNFEEADRKDLIDFYAPHNRRLYDLIGRDFDWH
jgi:hypothetical protein